MHRLTLPVLGFLYVTIIANVCLFQPVNGDEALITEVCSGTPWPDTCQRCLSTPPGSDAKDEKGLAGISIRCSLSLSNVVYSDFDEFSNATGDYGIKVTCDRCKESIWDATKSLMGAQVDWSNGQYDVASHHLVKAVESYSVCSQIFQNITVPAPFMNDFTSLKQFYLNTQAILNHMTNIPSCD